jgi:hypothetical protein
MLWKVLRKVHLLDLHIKSTNVSLYIDKVALNNLTNIDGNTCTNIPEAVNKLALSARLDHSCETG